jgi:hypothetical protein
VSCLPVYRAALGLAVSAKFLATSVAVPRAPGGAKQIGIATLVEAFAAIVGKLYTPYFTAALAP